MVFLFVWESAQVRMLAASMYPFGPQKAMQGRRVNHILCRFFLLKAWLSHMPSFRLKLIIVFSEILGLNYRD